MSAFDADIARGLKLRAEQVGRTLELQADGATVPFIARYRKEATGGLDEVQIQAIFDEAERRQPLAERREAVLRSIDELGTLTPELRKGIEGAATRAELEDLYLPYRPKRRTRAAVARERGLEPLAGLMWRLDLSPGASREALAAAFVDPGKGVPDAEAALARARRLRA